MIERRVLVDMDDVLVDFGGGSAKHFGLTREQLETKRPAGQWNTETCCTGKLDRDEAGIIFWRLLRAIPNFWEDLKPLPHMAELLGLVESIDPNYKIVTAPPKDNGLIGWAHAGKLEWIRRHLGEQHAGRMILIRDKHLLARPKTLLIDDRGESIVKFRYNGGLACTFPTRGNKLHSFWESPMVHVRLMLEEFSTL